ncbi:hypothetical protein QF039_005978 [Pseudomonas sp. W2I6]|jgi:hypothetical protein|nr:hypothetical protein [Pseudomonas sp. W2I6]
MTWLGAWSRSDRRRITTVGAGLLANAVDQSAHLVTETPHSRASPLPHFDRVRSLQRERQRGLDLLALRQAHLKLARVVNQHVLPGERFSRNQA